MRDSSMNGRLLAHDHITYKVPYRIKVGIVIRTTQLIRYAPRTSYVNRVRMSLLLTRRCHDNWTSGIV